MDGAQADSDKKGGRNTFWVVCRQLGAIMSPTPYLNRGFCPMVMLSPFAVPVPPGCRTPVRERSHMAQHAKSDMTKSARSANPHDAFFKHLFGRSALAASFCAHYLPPDIAQTLRLDPAMFTPMPTESLDRQLRGQRADVAYRVPRADGSPLHIHVVFEHKSYMDLLTAFQITRYCMGIWEAEFAEGKRRLSPILPVVVYHGRRPWRAATDLGGLIDAPDALQAFLPHLRYHLVSISPHDPPPSRGIVSLRVGLEVLQSIFRTGSELEARLVAAIARLAERREPDLITEDVAPILVYANQVHADLTAERLERVVSTALPDLGGVVMDKTFENLIQEGMRRGREVGIQEGERKGREAGVREGERRGREAGIQAGLQDAIMLGIEIKFGADGLNLLPEVRRLHDLNTLRAIREALPRIQTVSEFLAVLRRRD